MTNSKKTAGLKSSAAERTKKTFIKAEKTIAELLKRHECINFQAIAKQAGISKAYLYNDPKLRRCIEENRLKSRGHTIKAIDNKHAKKQSQIIDELKRRIDMLEIEKIELKKQIEVLYGKFFE